MIDEPEHSGATAMNSLIYTIAFILSCARAYKANLGTRFLTEFSSRHNTGFEDDEFKALCDVTQGG